MKKITCLNRTSVGLKQDPESAPESAPESPQSNQRGIETSGRKNPTGHCNTASIEPAWD